MSKHEREHPLRGRRNPTSVWIRKYRGKRGTTYRLRWIDPMTGEERTETAGRDLALARQRRTERIAELRDGLSGRLPDKTLEELREALDTFMTGKSPHTLRKTKRSVKDLIDLCGNRRLEMVDRGFVMEFREKRIGNKVSRATVNKDLRQIKSALSYAVDARWLRSNPLWRWKGMQMKEPEKRIRVIEADEFGKLLASCTLPSFRSLLIVGYSLGLRRSELVNLRWTAVDFDKGVLHVENVAEAAEFTKSRKNRTIPMRPEVREGLASLYHQVPKIVEGGDVRPKFPHCFIWDDGKPFLADWATHEFARVVKRAKIPHCSLHDLRRSFSTIAQRAGVDKATVKDLGGWSTISVVEKHYTGEIPEVFRRAMEKIGQAQEKAG